MQVSLESVSPTKLRLTVVLPASEVAANKDKEFQKFQQNARIPGYRQGKVPASYIEKRYGKGIMQDVVVNMIQASFNDAIKEKNIRFVGKPDFDFEVDKYEAGNDVVYHVNLEVEPTFEIVELTGQTLVKKVADITDADVEQVLSDMRKTAVKWNAVDREARLGDRVTLGYTGLCEGKAYPHNVAKEMALILESKGKYLKGFEEAVMGMKPGETKTVTINYPVHYKVKQIAGKPVELTLKIAKIEEPTLPQIDEKFAEHFGIKDGNLDKMREELKTNMKNEADLLSFYLLREQAVKRFCELNQVDTPEAILHQAKMDILNDTYRKMQSGAHVDYKNLIDSPNFDARAREASLATMLFTKIIAEENLQPSDEDIKEVFAEMTRNYNYPEYLENKLRSDQKEMERLKSMALERRVIKRIIEKATIEEKQVPYFELMKSAEEMQEDTDHVHDENCAHNHEHHEHGENCNHEH